MADNIVGGLFGIMPEDIAAQRMAAIDQQAQAFGRMSGREANRALGYKAGAVLGQGLFGIQDPQMERVRQRQQMAQGIDWNDPESLLQAAQAANQAGDTQAAQALYSKAVTLKQAQADLLETQAKTKKANLEQQPDKVRIAKAFADNNAQPNTPEWSAAFNEALNNQITPRGGSTPVTLQEQQLIAKLEDDISKGNPLDDKSLNQARFILGKLKQPKRFVDSQTGEIVETPGANINELAPNLASRLFGGTTPTNTQSPAIGQPQGQPAPYGVTTLPTPKSEAIKAKELENVKASVTSLDTDLANVDEAIKRTSKWSTGWANYAFGGMPNTDAMALNDIVNSINAAKVFTELGKLKEQSRTGASGLGSVTEREIGLLESRIRTLNPKSKTFPDDLKYIQTKWKELRDKMQLKAQGQVPPVSPTSVPKSDEDIIARAMAHPSAQGFTREQVISGLRKAGRIK
jgi:hypothetical protein